MTNASSRRPKYTDVNMLLGVEIGGGGGLFRRCG